MREMTRRGFLGAAALAPLAGGELRPLVGLVQSTHARLERPASPEDPLDYARVRDMVWKAIEYGAPRAGSLEAKIRPDAWVVVKPNMVLLRPQPSYGIGDTTDLRVTRAVVEYLARRSHAGRITVAEGGSYRGLRDPMEDNVVMQNGVRVDLTTFDWGPDEFPGTGGSVGGMLKEFQAQFSGKQFDYIDLNYDAVRDASGRFRRWSVPRSASGAGAFGRRPDYYVTKTLLNCGFVITVPVMKTHTQCGVTACFKNFVGTAPREAYQTPGMFNNLQMHAEQAVHNRLDHFIVDLASYHPPDYCVVDGIRGLQFQEHNNGRTDQMIRSNMVLAGEDPVATDALVSYLMGFNVRDMEFLHLATQRGLGTMELAKLDVRGDDPPRLRKTWGKPRDWYGRANREWLVSADLRAPLANWKRVTSPADTIDFGDTGLKPVNGAWGAAVRVRADAHCKAYLWLGLRGRVAASLNGVEVIREESDTRFRVGQFQRAVELQPGENLLVFQMEPLDGQALLSMQLVGARNDGDTAEGIAYHI
jgi:uncharacterized protein (DUF362 family)